MNGAIETHSDQIRELTESECWTLMRSADVGRLAVAIGDHPDIFPVNHFVDGNSILFRSAAGTKLAAAVLGRSVAFEVDGYDATDGEAWSVVVKGTARMIENMFEYLEAEELPLFPWHLGPKPNIVRIEPDEITGRRFFAAGRHTGAD
ncbi:MAG: pyridoxamine 5'-phosphate oxidase family protein [Ilumatobacter fluminis]|uniref:pyridoxamine 5'-phosphate oxidase family protein n=1 Tax=Ilumatobacter fluminis TaxID=467091 RepID=UPI0032EAB036